MPSFSNDDDDDGGGGGDDDLPPNWFFCFRPGPSLGQCILSTDLELSIRHKSESNSLSSRPIKSFYFTQ